METGGHRSARPESYMECIFCKIIAGEIPGQFLYQDDQVVAIGDIHPQTPTHVLVFPRAHIATLVELRESQESLVGHMIGVANKLARSQGVAGTGYRLVINCGKDADQVVQHLHLHLLGGRRLEGKMG